jgi:tRNA(Arg) A34 adenosine deaminase TadA
MEMARTPRFPAFTLALPDWVEPAIPPANHVYSVIEDRMALVIRLAELNVVQSTGGPFGAAIFDLENSTLVALGVNLVLAAKLSAAHAEIVAISLAQRIFGTHDLGAPGMPALELVTSCEPCAMCLGALPWSGIRSLVCGACDEDARAVGFDEGAKPLDWVGTLEKRGIRIRREVKRSEAATVLSNYLKTGGPIYNGGTGIARS